MDVKKLSNEKLLEIILKDENPNVPGSLHQKAVIEFSSRKSKIEQENQERLLSITQDGLNRIIDLLEFIVKKPRLAALYAGVLAVAIGLSVNVLTEVVLRLLHLKLVN